MRGAIIDASAVNFRDAALTTAFAARWCAPAASGTEDGLLRIRDDARPASPYATAQDIVKGRRADPRKWFSSTTRKPSETARAPDAWRCPIPLKNSASKIRGQYSFATQGTAHQWFKGFAPIESSLREIGSDPLSRDLSGIR